MFTRLSNITNRLCWPLAGATLALVLFIYLLQPRPDEEYRTSNNSIDERIKIQVSPSGKYIIQESNGAIVLSEWEGMRAIFTHSCINMIESRFDDEDGLAFASYCPGPKESKNLLMQQWHWLPGQHEPRMVGSHKSISLGLPRNVSFDKEKFNGLYKIGNGVVHECILSPDARTWLTQQSNANSYSFVLIDARTGQVKAQLERPEIDIAKPSSPALEAAFSGDSRLLLTQTPNNELGRYSAYSLEWFDAESGKQIKPKHLPEGVCINSLCQLKKDNLIGLRQINHIYCLQMFSDEQGYRLFRLADTIPEPAEHSRPNTEANILEARTDMTYRVDDASQIIVYCWSYSFDIKTGEWEGSTPFLPGYYFSSRDMNTGKLIHSERMPDSQLYHPDYFSPDGWRMLDVLPGPVLVLMQPTQQTPWQENWESYRRQYFSWFPASSRNQERFLFIEATTGKRLGELSTPLTEITHFYHKQQHALYIVGNIKDQIVIQKYTYPLHKPWLLILFWTLGVFAVLVSLQWLATQFLYRIRHVRVPGKTK